MNRVQQFSDRRGRAVRAARGGLITAPARLEPPLPGRPPLELSRGGSFFGGFALVALGAALS
jgi:hypothetical protein